MNLNNFIKTYRKQTLLEAKEIGRPTKDIKQDVDYFLSGKNTSTKMQNDSNDVGGLMAEIKEKIKPYIKFDTVDGEHGIDALKFLRLVGDAVSLDKAALSQTFNKLLTQLEVPGSVSGSTNIELAKDLIDKVNEKYSGLAIFGKSAELARAGKGMLEPEGKVSIGQKAIANVLSKRAAALSREEIAKILDDIDVDEFEGLSPKRKIGGSEEDREVDKRIAKKIRQDSGQTDVHKLHKDMAKDLWTKYFATAAKTQSFLSSTTLKQTASPTDIVKAAVKEEKKEGTTEKPADKPVEGGKLPDKYKFAAVEHLKNRFGNRIPSLNKYNIDSFIDFNDDGWDVYLDPKKTNKSTTRIVIDNGVVKLKS